MKKKPVFVAATGQHVGKTTTALGLLNSFNQRGLRPHFMKPVGQHYVDVEGVKVDEDALLVRDTFGAKTLLKDMSPVTVPRGFTESYIRHRDQRGLRESILKAYEALASDAESMVVEGTGHAGVGAVFDLCNAEVAAMLNAPVIIISEGGIGRPIDEICLNRALFAEKGVPVLGAVLNKILPEKYDRITEVARMGLEALGIRLLGALPYEARLTFPTVKQVALELEAEVQVLVGPEHLDNVVEHTVIAAMEPQNMVAQLREKTLVITPGDRIDNILVSISSHLVGFGGAPHISGILLTGGLVPHPTIISLLRGSQIPVLLCGKHTYEVSAQMTDMVFKINPADTDKIAEAQKLVGQHVDLDYIIDAL